jgi:shikimate dehydrogenase
MPAPLQEVVLCLGQPVAGNPTQYMMEKAFAAAGLDWQYLTCEVPPEKLADAMAGIRALGFKGANFTIPHKVAVIPYLDELSSAASLMGAVNCVNRIGDKLIGDNADGKGFLQSLRETCNPAGMTVAILGAGGAARAIAVELTLAGVAQIIIVNRQRERGESLTSLLREKTSAQAEFVHLQGDYFVSPHLH